MIEIERLRRDFGGIRALDSVDLRVGEGERHALIGPNGAGKSTLFNVLTGDAILSLRGAYRPFRSPAHDELASADTVLGQVGLAGQEGRPAGGLSHGERRQLELALALARKPRVLLLDEPTAGMSPAETDRITALIASLDRSLTVLIVEHDMDVVFRLADRITVLHEGRPIASGTPAEIRSDTQVHDVYLGKAIAA